MSKSKYLIFLKLILSENLFHHLDIKSPSQHHHLKYENIKIKLFLTEKEDFDNGNYARNSLRHAAYVFRSHPRLHVCQDQQCIFNAKHPFPMSTMNVRPHSDGFYDVSTVF